MESLGEAYKRLFSNEKVEYHEPEPKDFVEYAKKAYDIDFNLQKNCNKYTEMRKKVFFRKKNRRKLLEEIQKINMEAAWLWANLETEKCMAKLTETKEYIELLSQMLMDMQRMCVGCGRQLRIELGEEKGINNEEAIELEKVIDEYFEKYDRFTDMNAKYGVLPLK